jgi:carboxymethylenebutenolidase
VPKDDARIKTEYVTVPSPQGNGSIKGYFAAPANLTGKAPAVLVIHENRGLNPYVEDVARRFATNNFIALAPDGLTSVGGYPGDDEQGAVKFRQVNGPKMFEDFVAAAQWLKQHPQSTGKLGAIGFCFGGGIVNQLAVRLGAGLNAGAPFYGAPPSAEDTAKIQAPMMLHYADPTKDTGIGQRIPAYEAALKANNKQYQLFVYDGANHGFHNDTTPRYDEAAAKLAWQRTLDFFNKNLRG